MDKGIEQGTSQKRLPPELSSSHQQPEKRKSKAYTGISKHLRGKVSTTTHAKVVGTTWMGANENPRHGC